MRSLRGRCVGMVLALTLVPVSACGGEQVPREGSARPPASAPQPASAASATPDDPWRTARATGTTTLRARPELIEAMRTSRANAANGTAIEQPPPREDELAWMLDRAIPIPDRLDVGGALFLDINEIMKVVMARGIAGRPGVSAAASNWIVAAVAVLSRVAEVMAQEQLPSLAHGGPAYADQVGRITRLGQGAAGMLVASLLMMQDSQGNLWVRREHLRAWARNVRSFTFIWTAEQCRTLSQAVAEASRQEQDVEIVRSLHEIRDQLTSCPKAL